jgi:hypothetical protein
LVAWSIYQGLVDDVMSPMGECPQVPVMDRQLRPSMYRTKPPRISWIPMVAMKIPPA